MVIVFSVVADEASPFGTSFKLLMVALKRREVFVLRKTDATLGQDSLA